MAKEDVRVSETRERLVDLLPAATETLEALLESFNPSVRLNAAKDILDRGGLDPRKNFDINVTVGLDEEIVTLLAGIKRQQDAAKESNAIYVKSHKSLEDNVTQLSLLDVLAQIEEKKATSDDVIVDAEIVEEEEPLWSFSRVPSALQERGF